MCGTRAAPVALIQGLGAEADLQSQAERGQSEEGASIFISMVFMPQQQLRKFSEVSFPVG